jgi:hypothetical protein
MSLYVLSECEHYRLDWIMHRNYRPLTFRSFFKAYLAADSDRAFKQIRDYLSYHFGAPDREQPPRDGWFSRDTLRWLIVDWFIFHCLFLISWMCLSYPVKCLANPDFDGENLSLVISFTRVLYTPTNTLSLVPNSLSLMLGLKLQRPIQLLNRMLFWLIVGFTKYVWKWRRTREATILP